MVQLRSVAPEPCRQVTPVPRFEEIRQRIRVSDAPPLAAAPPPRSTSISISLFSLRSQSTRVAADPLRQETPVPPFARTAQRSRTGAPPSVEKNPVLAVPVMVQSDRRGEAPSAATPKRFSRNATWVRRGAEPSR